MHMKLYARQGDLVISRIAAGDAPPMTEQTAPVILAGADRTPHSVPAGVHYVQDGREHFVLSPDVDVMLTHAAEDGHRDVPLLAGQAYKIWPQIERRGDGDVDVED